MQDDEAATFGQRAADLLARVLGSWWFILGQTFLLFIWVCLNLVAWDRHWDPYPFILMNLVLSLQAAYTGPILLMSQNRQDAKDRQVLYNIYRKLHDIDVDVQASLRPPPFVPRNKK